MDSKDNEHCQFYVFRLTPTTEPSLLGSKKEFVYIIKGARPLLRAE